MKLFEMTAKDWEYAGKDNSDNDKLKKKMSEVDEKYSPYENGVDFSAVPETLGLQKMEYQMPSRIELTNNARNSLWGDYLEKKIATNQKAEQKKTVTQNDFDDLIRETEQKIIEEGKKRDKYNEDAMNNAIDNGIARSSIVENQIADRNALYDENFGKLTENKDYFAKRLEDKLAQITSDAEETLKGLDDKLDADVKASVQKMLDKAKSEMLEVIKYNNSVDEKEAKYALSRDEALREAKNDEAKRAENMATVLARTGQASINDVKAQEKAEIVLDFLSQYDAEKALKEFYANEKLKDELGKYYATVEAELKKKTK